MEAIDRLGWADGMVFSAYGRHVGFRTNEPALLERVPALLPPGWKPSDRTAVRRVYSLRVGGDGPRPGVRRKHFLYMNAVVLERSMDLEYLIERLEADIQLYIAERARRRVFIHAGVVEWEGRAILLPGRTMSGKTTLVSELLRQGATYYSDEYAVLDEKGRVHPFAKDLSVRERPGSVSGTKRSPGEWDAPVGHRPIPVGLVALTRFREGSRWRPRAISEGRSVLAMLEHAVPARRRPKVTFRTLQAALKAVPVLQGVRGEAEATARSLLRTLSRQHRVGRGGGSTEGS
jgi:hypothetical protein